MINGFSAKKMIPLSISGSSRRIPRVSECLFAVTLSNNRTHQNSNMTAHIAFKE